MQCSWLIFSVSCKLIRTPDRGSNNRVVLTGQLQRPGVGAIFGPKTRDPKTSATYVSATFLLAVPSEEQSDRSSTGSKDFAFE